MLNTKGEKTKINKEQLKASKLKGTLLKEDTKARNNNKTFSKSVYVNGPYDLNNYRHIMNHL